MRNPEIKKQNKNGFFNGLLGEPNAAKASGATFTLVSILPVFLSVIFIIVIGVLGFAGEEVTKNDWYIYAGMLLVQISFVLIAIWYFKWTKKSIKTAFLEQKCHPKYFLWAIILQFGLMSLSELNTLFLKLLGNVGYQDSGLTLPSMEGWGFVGVFLVVAVLPAILEEMIFRGLLLKGLRGFGTTGAVLICGALFALYHQNPAQTIYQFCCGAAFALVAVKSGSILPTVLSHFINNALILVLTNLGISSFSTPVFVTVVVVCSVCLITSLIYLIFIDRRGACTQRTKKTDKNERRDFWIFAAVGVVVCLVSWGTMLFSGIVGS